MASPAEAGMTFFADKDDYFSRCLKGMAMAFTNVL